MNIYRSFIFLAIFNTLTTFGQFSLKVKDVDLIGYNDNRLYLYTSNNNNFQKISINIKEEGKFEKLSIDSDYTPVQLNDLKDIDLVKKTDIKCIDFDKIFKHKKYEIIEGNNKWSLSKFNNYFVMVEQYKCRKIDDSDSEKHHIDWEIYDVNYYNIYYIDIGNNKKILIINDRDGFIIPIKGKIIINFDGLDFTNSEIIKNSSDDLSSLRYFNAKENYYMYTGIK